MHVLAHALHAAWCGLPVDVQQDRDITGADGLPTRTAREYLLREFVSLQRKLLIGAVAETRIDDADARRLREEVAAGAPLLLEVVFWLRTLRATGRAGGVESRLKAARDLARAHPRASARLGDDEAADLARDFQAARRRDVLAAADLRSVMADEAARQRLNARVDRVWAGRSPTSGEARWRRDPSADDRRSARNALPPERLSELRRLGLPLAFVTFSGFDDGRPRSTPESEWVWARLLAEPPVLTDAAAAGLGLLRGLPVPRPRLTGRLPGAARGDDAADPATYPLDDHLHARLQRAVRPAGVAFPADLTAERAFEIVVEGSGRPSGLPHAWADAVLAIGAAIAGLLTWAPGADDRAGAAILDGGAATIARNWQREVAKTGAHGRRALGAEVLDLIQNPMSHYLGKVWTRVLRQTLISPQPPSAETVWAHVHGAYYSIRKQLSTFAELQEADGAITASRRQRDRDADDFDRLVASAAGGVARLPGAVVLDVLGAAAEAGEGAGVLAFWNALAALHPRATDPPSRVQEWERWVAAYRQTRPRAAGPFRAHDGFEAPFAVARFQIASRGPL